MSENLAMYRRTNSGRSSARSTELLQHRSAQVSFRSVSVEDSDDDVPGPAKIRPHMKLRILEIWFRSLRPSILWKSFRRASHPASTEEPKQAIKRGFATALLKVVVAHLVPVAAAIALVSLNVHGYYIGGELAGPVGYDDVKLSGLQFSAKLHELTMQGSLSIVVIGLIRHELVAGEGIPFGAVFGRLQFSDLSYLYSKEFTGILRAKFAKRIVKARLVSVLLVGALLALTVGPSSAIAMRPRIDNWPAGGTDFYLNATFEEIWPSSINASNIPTSCKGINLSSQCVSGGWESIMDEILTYWPRLTNRATMPELLQMASQTSVRSMYTRDTKGLYPFFETVATLQMSNMADSLAEIGRLWSIAALGLSDVSPKQPRKFMYRKDAIYTLNNVYQPITAALCRAYRSKAQLQKNLLQNVVQVPIAASLCNGTIQGADYLIPFEQSTLIAEYNNNSLSSPTLNFVELPYESFGNNTIGALIAFPQSWPGGSNFLTCAVDARWIPVTIQSTRNIMKVVTGQPPEWPGQGVCIPSLPTINATAEWAQYLNPYIQDSNKTVFNTLVNSVGMQESQWRDDSGFVEGLMESILTMVVTSGLSRTSSSATIQGNLNHCSNGDCGDFCGLWCLDMMPTSNLEFGYGGNIYNLSGISDPSKLSRFTVQVEVNGYAYNIRGVTTILSCVVLLLYCLMAMAHTVFVLFRRTSSNAWESVSEVTALAMQSKPSEALKNTCAGISTTGVFSRFVKVIRTGFGEDHLELRFDGEGAGECERLVEDDFYG